MFKDLRHLLIDKLPAWDASWSDPIKLAWLSAFVALYDTCRRLEAS